MCDVDCAKLEVMHSSPLCAPWYIAAYSDQLLRLVVTAAATDADVVYQFCSRAIHRLRGINIVILHFPRLLVRPLPGVAPTRSPSFASLKSSRFRHVRELTNLAHCGPLIDSVERWTLNTNIYASMNTSADLLLNMPSRCTYRVRQNKVAP